MLVISSLPALLEQEGFVVPEGYLSDDEGLDADIAERDRGEFASEEDKAKDDGQGRNATGKVRRRRRR